MQKNYQATTIIATLICIATNALAIQHDTTVIQTGNSSPYIIQNTSPSKNGNLIHASLLFYKAANGVSCACGRYDSIAMPSDTMVTWSGQIAFGAHQSIQIVKPVFPVGAQCMQVALYGNTEAIGSKKNTGWFVDKKKEWACFNKGVKKMVWVVYNPSAQKLGR